MTLLTRDMIAYMDESGTKNVEIPAEDSARAISWPLYLQYGKRHEKLAKRNAWHRVRGARLRHDHGVVAIVRCGLQEHFHGFGIADSEHNLAG